MINGVFILKGIVIGMLVCIPIGPLGFLSVQRTIKEGRMIGFLSGVGAALSDSIYSSIAIFGISFIDEIIENYNRLITIGTGILFLIIGLYIVMNSEKNNRIAKEVKGNRGRGGQIANTMASTFIMGLSNPMTFFIFLAIFAKMGIEVNAEDFVNNIGFVLSILSGSCILWIIVTNIIKLSKKSFDISVIIIIDKIIGILIFLFGVFNLFKGVRKV